MLGPSYCHGTNIMIFIGLVYWSYYDRYDQFFFYISDVKGYFMFLSTND